MGVCGFCGLLCDGFMMGLGVEMEMGYGVWVELLLDGDCGFVGGGWSGGAKW